MNRPINVLTAGNPDTLEHRQTKSETQSYSYQEPLSESIGQIRSDNFPRRSFYIVRSADVFVGPRIGIENPKTQLRISIARLANTSNVDEVPILSRNPGSVSVDGEDRRHVRMTNEAE
jgi:hypothetical protein